MNADQHDSIMSIVFGYLGKLTDEVLKANTNLDKNPDDAKCILDSIVANGRWLAASELANRIIDYINQQSH